MKLTSFIKTTASKKLQKDIEEDLKNTKEIDIEEYVRRRNTEDHTKSIEKDGK